MFDTEADYRDYPTYIYCMLFAEKIDAHNILIHYTPVQHSYSPS